MYRPEPQTRRGSSRAEPGSSQEPGSSRDPWLSQRQAFHDAANWLTVLLGHLEFLRGEPDSVRHIELARRAARAAHRLCALPPGSGSIEAALDAVRHGERALDHMRPAAAARGVSLRLDHENLPPVVADAAGFDDALLNLLRNALEASPDGGDVALLIEKAGAGFVRVRVEDQGPGIPVDRRAPIGRPGLTDKDGVDRGLGLSRVRAWLAERGAELEIGDAPGGGASVGFTLVGVVDAGQEVPRKDGALRVLLVEDDLAVAEVLALLLATDGHRVDQAGDVGAAEALFDAGIFDLVLCDQNLPDGRGEDLARWMVGQDPRLSCFLVTGAPESVNCSGDSRLSVLAKPVSRDDLRRAVADTVQFRADPTLSPDT